MDGCCQQLIRPGAFDAPAIRHRKLKSRAVDIPEPEMSCLTCAKPGTKTCGGCGIAPYCSREHQVAGWPAHKPACLAVRAEKAKQAAEEVKTEEDLVIKNVASYIKVEALKRLRPLVEAILELGASVKVGFMALHVLLRPKNDPVLAVCRSHVTMALLYTPERPGIIFCAVSDHEDGVWARAREVYGTAKYVANRATVWWSKGPLPRDLEPLDLMHDAAKKCVYSEYDWDTGKRVGTVDLTAKVDQGGLRPGAFSRGRVDTAGVVDLPPKSDSVAPDPPPNPVCESGGSALDLVAKPDGAAPDVEAKNGYGVSLVKLRYDPLARVGNKISSRSGNIPLVGGLLPQGDLVLDPSDAAPDAVIKLESLPNRMSGVGPNLAAAPRTVYSASQARQRSCEEETTVTKNVMADPAVAAQMAAVALPSTVVNALAGDV